MHTHIMQHTNLQLQNKYVPIWYTSTHCLYQRNILVHSVTGMSMIDSQSYQLDIPVESQSDNVGLDSEAFPLTTELFECANQIVACPMLVQMLIDDN